MVIYSRKAYEKSDKRALDPAEISWSDEMGDTPVFYNSYVDLAEPEVDWDIRPIRWILGQLTGQKVVCCLNLLLLAVILLPQHTFTFTLGISILRLLPPGSVATG